MHVLDSSILIDTIRGLKSLQGIQSMLKGEQLMTTSITVHELYAGAKTEKQRFILQHLFSGIQILGHDVLAAKTGGRIQRELTKRGTEINKMDVLIAGICKANNAVLVTSDRDFAKIKGFKAKIIT